MIAVERHKEETGTVASYRDGERVELGAILELPCDILIPAALENQITTANAERIDARLIVEAANGPVTPEADDVLAARGVKVLPDILANAGGVVVSYFEWAQNIENQRWEDADVREKLRRRMRRATEVVVTKRASMVDGVDSYRHRWAETSGDGREILTPDLRTAAQTVAIGRCRDAALQRGVWP